MSGKACQHMGLGKSSAAENITNYYNKGRNMSAFELTSAIYKSGSLHKIKLTPTTKLVLLALTNHYNPNKPDMFPSQKYLATQLGIGTRSVARAIDELSKKGLIIYETKTVNRYKFTNLLFNIICDDKKIQRDEKKFGADKLANNISQNDTNGCAKMANKQINEKIINNKSNFIKNSFNGSNNSTSSFNDYKSRKYPQYNSYNSQPKGVNYQTYTPERVEKGSPLDFSKEQAVEYLNNLPSFLNESYFAKELRRKWSI